MTASTMLRCAPWRKRSGHPNDNSRTRREKLTGPGVTVSAKTTRREGAAIKKDGSRVPVGIARDLAEHPVGATGVGQNDSGSELGRGQIGKWETEDDD